MQRNPIKNKFQVILSLAIATFALSSCGRQAVYEEHVDVRESGWFKDSVITFTVTIEDTATGYDLMLYLRNNDQYTYSNIYFFRSLFSEKGMEFADTAEYPLADPYGKWLGKGVGSIRSHEWPYSQSKVYFKRPGIYTFKVQHAMRAEELQGIESVGMGVFKAENRENQ